MFSMSEVKMFSAGLALLLFDVFFLGTNIMFTLVNSADVFMLMGGVILGAVILAVNVVAGRFIFSQLDVGDKENK